MWGDIFNSTDNWKLKTVLPSVMNRIEFMLLLLVLLISCDAPKPSSLADPEDVIGISTAWTGTSTCTDCTAAIHDLTLNVETGRFQLVSTYQGTKNGDRSYTRDGRFTWAETVVCLNAEPPSPTECFFLQDVNTLVRLDMAGEVTSDKLKRK
jgi:hypothetical protein